MALFHESKSDFWSDCGFPRYDCSDIDHDYINLSDNLYKVHDPWLIKSYTNTDTKSSNYSRKRKVLK